MGAAHLPAAAGGRLSGKAALITGAARGIGYTLARAFVQEGAQVMLADINAEAAAAAAREIGAGAHALEMDVTSQSSINRAIAATVKTAGGLDILVNNAAIFDMAPITEISRDSYEKVFAVNVGGVLFTLQAAAKEMIARGRGGKILNLASQAGRRGEPLVAVYCASKAAVISITQSAGLNLIAHGINVNAIAPGVVDGAHWTHVDSLFAKYENLPLGEKKRRVGRAVPYGRMGQAADLIGVALLLASSEGDYIVAQTYNVDGGNWLS